MTAFNIRRLHPDILAIDDGTRAWTVTVDPDRSVRRIANATSGRALKLDGPLGKRITAAVHDWLVECAEQLPAAIDEYVRTLTDSTDDAARHDAWHRCLQFGANRYDYDRARRRAEGKAGMNIEEARRDADLQQTPAVFDTENRVMSIDHGGGLFAAGERIPITERSYVDIDSGDELFREGVLGR